MEYIAHRRCKEISAAGERLNIPYGSAFTAVGDFIATPEGKAICCTTSETAYRYFARNDDGRGLERGELTYAIAYGRRSGLNRDGRYYRLNDGERAMLRRRWPHFLREYEDTVLFNHAFFNAGVEELREIAGALKIRVKQEDKPCMQS